MPYVLSCDECGEYLRVEGWSNNAIVGEAIGAAIFPTPAECRAAGLGAGWKLWKLAAGDLDRALCPKCREKRRAS